MKIDWTTRSTVQLKLVLGSLKRLQGNEKTERQKEKTVQNIKAIEKILSERGS